MLKTAQLPDNVDALKALLSDQSAQLELLWQERAQWVLERDTLRQDKHNDKQEIERLSLLLEKLKRMLFGRKSEKLLHQIEQLELELEEAYINEGQRQEKVSAQPAVSPAARAPRQPLPEHLPRQIHEHLPADTQCPDCGGAWKRLGEDVSEMLDLVRVRFHVVRHVRPRLACSCCDRIVQAPAVSRPIARSYAGPALLAHIATAKYLDHLPLYRQTQAYGREGVALSESTLGDWIGALHELMRPLTDALKRHVFAAEKIHTDDTPAPVLAPGTGKTRQARLWTYVRDDRPHGGKAAPAAWYCYSPDRKGIHPQTHLKNYSGILQADAYAGYNAVYETGRVLEAGCWAHARRHFYDIHEKRPSAITTHALETIAQLYRIEADIRSKPPNERREMRQARAAPIVTALHDWLTMQLATVPKKSVTADAIGYALNQWQALTRFLEDGRIELDNNAAERALRAVGVGRKNYLFLGSDAGGERAATMYSLLGTAKLNGLNPEAYLTHVLERIAEHPVNRADELLPWNVRL
jgi:transposase